MDSRLPRYLKQEAILHYQRGYCALLQGTVLNKQLE
jgi:hypothetical protein